MTETLGRYTLIEKLAKGGMAEIWLASLSGPGGFSSRCVIKRILPHLAESEEFVQMFLDEARIASRLHHPNIAQVFDFGEQAGMYFLAMEYVPGQNLRRLCKEAEARHLPLPLPLVVRILIEVAHALGYAHAVRDESGQPLHIIHRDVSPQNILVTPQGGVKLVDFGIARAADQLAHTRTGVLKGKFAYMSPEQTEAAHYDNRADLFALGVVGFELLTGYRLFKRDSDVATLKAAQDCLVPAPSLVTSGVPPALDAIVLKALARDPADRFQTGEAMAQALEDFLHASQQPASATLLANFLGALSLDPPVPNTAKADQHSTEGSARSDLSVPLHLLPKKTSLVASALPSARTVGLPPESDTRATVASVPLVTVDVRPRLAPSPLRTVEAPATPRTGLLRQLAKRGPIRDPRRGADPEELPQPQRAWKEAPVHDTPADGIPVAARSRRWVRWVKRTMKTLLVVGLIALGVAALPGLRTAFEQSFGVGAEGDHGDGEQADTGPHGQLTLSTSTPANIYLGARLLGPTPLVELSLPAGRQTLRLVNDTVALDSALVVDIPADKTTVLHAELPEGSVEIPVPTGHTYQLLYRNKPLGRVPGPALQLSAGTHDLTLLDEATGQREQRTITVAPRAPTP